MAAYDRFGANVNDEPIACTELVTINSTTYYRGRALQLAARSVEGNTSPNYGVWTAPGKGGTRLNVVVSPGLPVNINEIGWDTVSGYLYSTISRTVYAYYHGHGSFVVTGTIAPQDADNVNITGGSISGVTFSAVTASVDILTAATRVLTPVVRATDNTGVVLQNDSGAPVLTIGGSGGTGASFAGNISVGGVLGLGSGSAGYASLYFNATDDGLYSPNPHQIAVTIDGAKHTQFDSTGLTSRIFKVTGTAGTAVAPALRLDAVDDSDTGLYKPAPDQIGFSAGAALRLLVSTSGITVTGDCSATGNVIVPSGGRMDFFADVPANHYIRKNPSTSNLEFVTGGALRFNIGTAGVYTRGLSTIVNRDSANFDFTVRTDGEDRTVFVQGSTNRVGIGTLTPSTKLDVNGTATATGFRLTGGGGTVPASASATGTAGDIRWDADYVYVCIAADTWKRAAISSW